MLIDEHGYPRMPNVSPQSPLGMKCVGDFNASGLCQFVVHAICCGIVVMSAALLESCAFLRVANCN